MSYCENDGVCLKRDIQASVYKAHVGHNSNKHRLMEQDSERLCKGNLNAFAEAQRGLLLEGSVVAWVACFLA